MTVMGKESENSSNSAPATDDVYRALIAVKEKASNGAFKTLGTGCAVRTGDIFGIHWRKKFHLLISAALVAKHTLEERENRGKYIGEFEHGKPRLELEKASNTFFKKEHKDFHFIAIGRGRSGKLGHHVLEICQLERDEVLRGKLVCFVTAVSNETSDSHLFKSHEIIYNAQSKSFETTDELGHDEFPRGAPVLNEHHEIVGIISGVTDGKKLEICFVSDSKPAVIEPPKVEESIIPAVVAEVESVVEAEPELPKINGDLKPPEKPQRSTKITRSQSERTPNHLGTGKDRDLRHSFRYGNRHGYKVYVEGEHNDSGVQRWKPKGFGAKKNLFEGKEPVKFLGARHIGSPVAIERQTKMMFNKARPKITSSVSLPCNLNKVGKTSRSFNGIPNRRVASTSNIPGGMYLIKNLPSTIKNKAADFLDDPAKGQLWRKIALHYRVREVEVNDLAFGASRHISGSETKALFQKLSAKNPNLTVLNLVEYLLGEHACRELLNMFLPYTYMSI